MADGWRLQKKGVPEGDAPFLPIRFLPSRFALAVAAAACAAATVSAAATAAITAAASATAAGGFRSRLVDCQVAAPEVGIVQLIDRLLRILIGHHLDERESAGTAGGHVTHQVHAVYSA